VPGCHGRCLRSSSSDSCRPIIAYYSVVGSYVSAGRRRIAIIFGSECLGGVPSQPADRRRLISNITLRRPAATKLLSIYIRFSSTFRPNSEYTLNRVHWRESNIHDVSDSNKTRAAGDAKKNSGKLVTVVFKKYHILLPVTSPHADWFSKFFHRDTLSSESIIKASYFKRVATLPCEIFDTLFTHTGQLWIRFLCRRALC